jgi:hypothetical protein
MAAGNNPRLHIALCTLAASCLVLAACGGSSPDGASEAESASRAMAVSGGAKPVFFERSFVITDRQVLDALAPDFKVGSLLYAVSRHLNKLAEEHPEWHKEKHDAKAFALQPFRVAGRDTDAHNALSNDDPDQGKVGTVPVIYNTFNKVILADGAFDPDRGVEPFRLIAVVNRLDLAGDFDMRAGGELGGKERRWFGEARLIFSVNGTLADGSPRPMTVSAEYRLPALKRNADGSVGLDNDFVFADGPADEADWRQRRQLWAKTWQDLSAYAPGTPEYLSRLRTILSWVAYGVPYDLDQIKNSTNAQHNLAFRTGEKVRVGLTDGSEGSVTDEFEYREFYLGDSWFLTTRKLRREPFACAAKSATLAKRIADDWWESTQSMSWRYILGNRNLEDEEIADLKAVCGKLPYGQVDDPDSDGNTDTQLRAKFGRFKATSVWRTRKSVTEPQVHSFALGTCSGCHSGETGTQGFHIGPSPVGQPAVLSAFLSPLQQPTSVTPRDTPYSSDEPARRMALVARFAAKDLNMGDDPLLYDIGCKDVAVPCLPQPPQ